MKKTLLLPLFVIICFWAKAQDEKFTGIGVLKINSDTTVLLNYANENKIKSKNMNNIYEFASNTLYPQAKATLYRLYSNKDVLKNIASLSYCPDVTEFLLTKYTVSGVEMNGVLLKYYKNQLISFKSLWGKDIEDAMKVKYGDVKVQVLTDSTNCIYNFTGNVRKLVSQSFYYEWKNDKITATSMLSQSYDDHCEKTYNHYFTYEVDNREAQTCESEGLTKKINDQNAPKTDKSKLKDF